MLIAHSRPGDIAWTLVGAGAARTSSADYLTDSAPAVATSFTWLTGAQTTASVLKLQGLWSQPCAPRIAGLLGLTLPAGTLVKVLGKRPADAGFTYALGGNANAGQRAMRRDDGSVAALFVLDAGLDEVEGVEFRIYNDVDGVASIAAGAEFDIGEAWISPALERDHDTTWSTEAVDPTDFKRSAQAQAPQAYDAAYQRMSVSFSGLTRSEAFDRVSGLSAIAQLLSGGRACIAIPRYLADNGSAIDATWLHQSALFGWCSSTGKNTHQLGDVFARDMTFDEAPALAVDL